MGSYNEASQLNTNYSLLGCAHRQGLPLHEALPPWTEDQFRMRREGRSTAPDNVVKGRARAQLVLGL